MKNNINKNGFPVRPRKLNFLTFIVGFALALGICYFIPKKDKVCPEKKLPVIDKSEKYSVINVQITLFHAVKSECGKFDKICASGDCIRESLISCSRWAGVSPNLNIKLNDTVEVLQPLEFSGKYIVKTFTAKSIHSRIDILVPKGQRSGLWNGTVKIKLKK